MLIIRLYSGEEATHDIPKIIYSYWSGRIYMANEFSFKEIIFLDEHVWHWL